MRYYPVHSGYPPYTRVNQAIEAAFAEHGRGGVRMPSKVYVGLVENGDFRTMPAYMPALGIAGVKIVNVHPNNRARGLPTVMALTEIIDVTTGVPQAIVNATGAWVDLTNRTLGIDSHFMGGTKGSHLVIYNKHLFYILLHTTS